MQKIIINPEFKNLIEPLTDDEFEQLERNIKEWGCREPLTMWAKQNILLDGHNRYEICEKHNIPYHVDEIELETRQDAISWIVDNQLGRRNLTLHQQSYYRGLQYEQQKAKEKFKGNQHSGGANSLLHQKTSEKLGRQHKVSCQTIKNDAQFARAVNSVLNAAGNSAKAALLSRDAQVTKQDVVKLGEIAQSSSQAVKNVMEQVKDAHTPKQTSQIIKDAHKQVATLKAEKELPKLILTAPQVGDRDEEIITSDGRKIYILHRPNSKPYFNKTNESVDWAFWTWNPITGCWHGCEYCYAREIANSDRMAENYPYKFEPTFHPARLSAPQNTPFPKDITDPRAKNVFTCSMSDLFGKWVPEEWIMQIFEVVKNNPQWNFLFLTKFPQRLQEICDKLEGFPDNAWVGTTVDTQARVKLAEKAFQNIDAKVKWLSCEPLLERLTFNSLSMFDWVVIGGQSASYFNGTPEFQPEWEWVSHLCKQAEAAKCEIYWKENLTVRPKGVPW